MTHGRYISLLIDHNYANDSFKPATMIESAESKAKGR
jgi:hypothetical protein